MNKSLYQSQKDFQTAINDYLGKTIYYLDGSTIEEGQVRMIINTIKCTNIPNIVNNYMFVYLEIGLNIKLPLEDIFLTKEEAIEYLK